MIFLKCFSDNHFLFLQEIMRRADTDSNAVIDLGEFVKYMHAHERKLHLAFTSLDRNHDGECIIMFCLYVPFLCYYFAALLRPLRR